MNDTEKNQAEQWMNQLEKHWGWNERSENKKWKRLALRIVIGVLVVFFGILCVRRGINFYLAKQAEGKLQTASSYKKIYQSFERVEMNQLHLRRKWENHRGINLSLNLEGTNLSSLMSSSNGAASVMAAVTDVTGIGGYGIGQYHQYMMAASAQDDSDSTLKSDDAEENIEQIAMDTGMKPDQFIRQGEYIYAFCMRAGREDAMGASLVVYHAAEGKMEPVFADTWSTSGSLEAEMIISGHYLYLAMNENFGYTYAQEKDCLVCVYDIINPADLQKKDVLKQSGQYERMQISGEYLYLLSKYQDFQAFDAEETLDYIPVVGGTAKRGTAEGSKTDGKEIPAKDIYMQRDLYGTGYVVISAYHLSDDGQPELTDAKAVAGTGDCIQMNNDTIYVCSQVVPKVTDHTDRTGITVLSYEDGKIQGEDHLIVPGSIDGIQNVSVNEACLSLLVQVNTYRNGFVEIEDWILPGWEGVPMKIQMQEDAVKTRKQNIAIDGTGSKVHEVDVKSSEEQIRDLGFEGQLFEVDEWNYIGLGHTDGDKHVKLLWYAFTVDEEPELQTSASIREYYSPAVSDGRKVYFDKDRSLIGFCATGSQGTFYYLYHYQQDQNTDAVELQELCQENFGYQLPASWIRGMMMQPEDNFLYMIRCGSRHIDGMAKPIVVNH